MGQSPLSPNSTLLLSPKGWDATSPKVKPVSPIIPRAMVGWWAELVQIIFYKFYKTWMSTAGGV